jgi:hypothetical protein
MDGATNTWATLPETIKVAISVARRGERVVLTDRFLPQRELDARGLAGSVRVLSREDARWTLALDHSEHASRSDRARTVGALRERLARAGYTVTSGGVSPVGGEALYVQSTVSAEDEAWLARHCAA